MIISSHRLIYTIQYYCFCESFVNYLDSLNALSNNFMRIVFLYKKYAMKKALIFSILYERYNLTLYNSKQ